MQSRGGQFDSSVIRP
nr:unnamed protein product [Callosobruchus chinensis]